MSDVEKLEEERDALRRELAGTAEMLAFVLQEIGQPVVVKKEVIDAGLPDKSQIAVDDHPDSFVFSLVQVSE